MVTLVVDRKRLRSLSRREFRSSPKGRAGVILCLAILVATPLAARLVHGHVAGDPLWDDPAEEARSLSAIVVICGVALAAVALRQSWYRAAPLTSMRVDQLVRIDDDGTLTHSFRVRGDMHPTGRNVVVARLGPEVTRVTYDGSSGVVTLEGTVRQYLNPDVSSGIEPAGPMRRLDYWRLPNCFAPDLVQEISRYVEVVPA